MAQILPSLAQAQILFTVEPVSLVELEIYESPNPHVLASPDNLQPEAHSCRGPELQVKVGRSSGARFGEKFRSWELDSVRQLVQRVQAAGSEVGFGVEILGLMSRNLFIKCPKP